MDMLEAGELRAQEVGGKREVTCAGGLPASSAASPSRLAPPSSPLARICASARFSARLQPAPDSLAPGTIGMHVEACCGCVHSDQQLEISVQGMQDCQQAWEGATG